MQSVRRLLQVSKSCRVASNSVQRRTIASRSLPRVWSVNSAAGGRLSTTVPSSSCWSQWSGRLSYNGTTPLASFFRGYADLPDHKEIRLPALSPTMSTGTILSWEKEEGEEITDGDVLAQVETDKATMDMDSAMSGYMAKIVVPAGTKDIPLGKLVCIMVENEEDVAAFKDYQPPADEATPTTPSTTPPAAEATPTAPSAPATQTPSQPPPPPTAPTAPPATAARGTAGRVFASPYAKTLAAEQGVDLQGIRGTGAGGRIVSRDIAGAQAVAPTAAAAPGTAGPYEHIELSNMRKTIAKRLQESKRNIPHYYLTVDINMDELISLRQQLNEQGQGDYKLSVNDFLIKAAALSMGKVPEVNSSWEEDHIRQYNQVDVSVAVSTDGGLITPIVFGAESKGLLAISSSISELAAKARDGKLQPHEFVGGTFTISNLGMFGIKQFTAVINPPQSCILAVGTTEKRVIVDETTTAGYRKANMMTVTLSCDHRVVDGAVGAQWLTTFKSLLEKPSTMLL